jgi:trans-aconitate 2-methyltransferase
VPLGPAARVADLGSGAGNVTRLVAERFPSADLVGVDNSSEMLERARCALPSARFVDADIARWEPEAKLDLVFSNAALHWLPDHPSLLPRLCAWLAPGGCLAVQMPGSFRLPSHTAAYEAARSGPWSELLPPGAGRAGVLELEDYYRILRPHVAALDLWETTYVHVLEGDDPVSDFFRSTLLLPYLEALPEDHRAGFLQAYSARVRASHPKAPDGRTLLPVRRLFFVAVTSRR